MSATGPGSRPMVTSWPGITWRTGWAGIGGGRLGLPGHQLHHQKAPEGDEGGPEHPERVLMEGDVGPAAGDIRYRGGTPGLGGDRVAGGGGGSELVPVGAPVSIRTGR